MKGIFCLGLCIAAIFARPVFAQDVALSSSEPVRFALVIGNSSYGGNTGNLAELGMACVHDPRRPNDSSPNDADGDADAVAKAFGAAGWTDVTKLCNQTTDELRTAIIRFATRVSRTRRALGVVYFSGHGAEIAGRNYLFGVDAMVDPAVEFQTFSQDKQTSLFGDTAVDLAYELRRLGQMYGKGLVFLIDACRNDVLAQSLRDAGIKGAHNPTLDDDDALQGIVFGFASTSGKPAPGSPLGKPTLYARTLVEQLTKAASKEMPIEEMITLVDTAIRIKEPDQRPIRIGELNNPPRLCVMGCPQLASAWLTAEEVDRVPPPAAPPNPVARAAPAKLWRAAVTQQRASLPIHRASLVRFQDVGSASEVVPARHGPRQIAVDILWCSGGSGDRERLQKATGLYERLKSDEAFMPLGTKVSRGAIQLLRFPLPLAQRFDISGLRIVADTGDAAEEAWADALRQLAADKYVVRRPRGGKTPDRVELYVCDGTDYVGTLDTVYFQAPDDSRNAGLVEVKTELQTDVAGLYVARPTDIRPSPKATEVRYFFPAQLEKAQMVANNLANQLGHPVDAKLVIGYEKQLQGKRVIEAWIGTAESSEKLAAAPR